MDKKIEELRKRLDLLEGERLSLMEQRGVIEKKINEIVVEQIRTDGGIRALMELESEQGEKV